MSCRPPARASNGNAGRLVGGGRRRLGRGALPHRGGQPSGRETSKEYSILELLSLRKGTTLTKEMFLVYLYGGIDEPELKIVDVFITKLRKKIAAATGGEHYIETVWGRGYVLKDSEGDSQVVQDSIALRRQRWSSFHQRSLEFALSPHFSRRVGASGLWIGKSASATNA